ncbi:hypothetical protein TrispH2_012021 [Trichoplax sp. H2]|nr:hypothetical protein TrispH2_012021 [Trichoplax sp. H2]|eukprot:RDD36243.1 hypothetical protein TrispH2_012021 [Trichoplax sp. H2]
MPVKILEQPFKNCILLNSHAKLLGYKNFRKAIRTTFLMVGTDVMCWFPLAFTCTLGATKYITFKSRHEITSSLEVAALLLSYCNIAINPYIYAGTNAV